MQCKYTESRLLAQDQLLIPNCRTTRLIRLAPQDGSYTQQLAVLATRERELKMGKGGGKKINAVVKYRNAPPRCKAQTQPPFPPPPQQQLLQISWRLETPGSCTMTCISSPFGGEGKAAILVCQWPSLFACSPCSCGLPRPVALRSHCSWAKSTAGLREEGKGCKWAIRYERLGK